MHLSPHRPLCLYRGVETMRSHSTGLYTRRDKVRGRNLCPGKLIPAAPLTCGLLPLHLSPPLRVPAGGAECQGAGKGPV
ncbi:hypothetical protein E2C01_100850 [Portunus trituberculatus]|uniref:Uncharacterized protein n=1 Tax=Portunus trituberculatus TaxID=210409 RepID=A0A5B7K469_PORTR|nr:hypothetical protein [Portunus trituberculatus]